MSHQELPPSVQSQLDQLTQQWGEDRLDAEHELSGEDLRHRLHLLDERYQRASARVVKRYRGRRRR